MNKPQPKRTRATFNFQRITRISCGVGGNFRTGVERDDVSHAPEAFERANSIRYGLSAGVWTDKGSKIFKMVNKLRAGVVWANTYNKFDPTSPFGGYKESGFGREGGLQGLAAYCKLD